MRDNLADRLRAVAKDVDHYIVDDPDTMLGMACEPHDVRALVDICRLIARDLDRSLADHMEGGPSVRYDVCARAVKGLGT